MKRDATNVVSHAAVYLLARGVPGAVAFLAIPLFSRLLDPAEYGRYALVLATVNVGYALLFQWLRLSLVRYLAASGDDPSRLKSTLVASTGVLVIATGALAGVACLLPVAAGWRGFILACWVLLAVQSPFELCCEYARGMLRPWQFMRLQLTRSVAFVGLGLGFVALGAGWWGPLAGMTVGMFVATALMAWREGAGVRPAMDPGILKALARYGLPLSLTVALTVVIGTSDRYLIAAMMGEGHAGLYAVAADFTAQTITLLMTAIHLAMFPVAVRAWEADGADAARERMRTNAAMLLAVGVPCVVGLSVIAPGIAHCFLGKSFRAAATGVIPLVALGTFLGGIKNYHFDAAFQFVHRTTSQVWIVLVAAALNVALNVVAIPKWGIEGAAGASVVAYGVAIALTVIVGRRHVWLPVPAGAAVRVGLAAGLMGLLLAPVRNVVMPWAVAGQILGGAAVYGAVLLATDFMGVRSSWLKRRGRGAVVAISPAVAPVVAEVG
jgi:O-antigen/teichoic acid export membrane protein